MKMQKWGAALLLGLLIITAGMVSMYAAKPDAREMVPAPSANGIAPGTHEQSMLLAQLMPGRRSREYVPSPILEPNETKMRQWLFAKLREYLGLDDATAKRFEPIFTDHSIKRRALEKKQHALVRRIDKAANDNSFSANQLRAIAQQYQEIDRSLSSERDRYYKKAGRVLDPRQMSKLIISEDKMKEDLFKRVRKDRSGLTGPREDTPPPPQDR